VTQAAVAAQAPKPSGEPKSGGTLRFGVAGEPPQFDGQYVNDLSQETIWLVYDRLTALDLNFQLQPMLAESWDFSSDAKQLKLNLRKGVQWHNGRELTSDDVKYSITRVRDPKVAGGQFTSFGNWFSTIDTPDKYSVVLESEQPHPSVFEVFEQFNIVDHETMEGPDAQTKMNGTGPFKFVERVQGDHWAFAKNANYWQTNRPFLDEVINPVRDVVTGVIQIEAGALDVVRNPTTQDVVRLRNDPNYQVIAHPAPGTFYEIGIRVTEPPLDSKQVRQALNYAFDRRRLADTLFEGTVQPRALPWDPVSPAYEEAKARMYAFDLDKAKSLLSSAGVGAFETDLILGNTDAQMYQFAQVYQGDLAKLGITLNVNRVERPVWSATVRGGNFKGFWVSNDTNANLSPTALLTISPGWALNINFSAFKNETYAGLVGDAISEPDAVKQKQIYARLNDFILDESFTIPLSSFPLILLTTTKVHGITPHMHQGFSLTEAWVEH
jgi:peptide/nickel transport system substrate-binding protein